MVKITDLINQILGIKGVMHYALVRDDGHTMSQNFKDFDTLPSIITFTGLNCEALKPIIGLSYFKYVSFIRENNEKLLIFPLGRYFLGISQSTEAYTQDIADRIEKIFDPYLK